MYIYSIYIYSVYIYIYILDIQYILQCFRQWEPASGPLLCHPSEPGGRHPAAAWYPLVGAPAWWGWLESPPFINGTSKTFTNLYWWIWLMNWILLMNIIDDIIDEYYWWILLMNIIDEYWGNSMISVFQCFSMFHWEIHPQKYMFLHSSMIFPCKNHPC